MTSILEKSLLLGFSIFLLTIFSSILIPFLGEIEDFNISRRNDKESYMFFIDEINHAILSTINNPEELYIKTINYPNNFNITVHDYFVICEFLYENVFYDKILVYNTSFFNCNFHGIPPQTYFLNVSYQMTQIFIKITSI
ncbi:unnamed protein product [marine sediment metagenome]|uniref:Uncharacterized protein n=1 Tax=marine sediment metagenome TaxID=412755 RepID=X1AMH7_9ZZZZ